MKNISLLLMLACLTILGCNQTPGGNPSPNNGNDYYMFSITIDGVTHKVEGYYSSPADMATGNFCHSNVASNIIEIAGQLGDKTVPSYVSGEFLSFALLISNASLGPQSAEGGIGNFATGISGQIMAPNNLNWPQTAVNVPCYSPNAPSPFGGNYFIIAETMGLNGLQGSTMFGLDNVVITDLGSAGTINPGNISNPYTFGDPVIGSFSGTIYGCSSSPSSYDIPVQLEIEFVAPRWYY